MIKEDALVINQETLVGAGCPCARPSRGDPARGPPPPGGSCLPQKTGTVFSSPPEPSSPLKPALAKPTRPALGRASSSAEQLQPLGAGGWAGLAFRGLERREAPSGGRKEGPGEHSRGRVAAAVPPSGR